MTFDFKFMRSFSQANFDMFATLSRDFNPIHVDPSFAANSGFGKTVAHGILLYSCLLEGLGDSAKELELLASDIIFPAPTFTDVEMEFSGCVINHDRDKVEIVLKSIDALSKSETCVINAQFAHNSASKAADTAFDGHAISDNAQIIKPFQLGQPYHEARAFTAQDQAQYNNLCGAKNNGNQIAKPLINAMFSKILGINLPGLGTNYLKQETKYIADAKINEPLYAEVKITRIRADKKILDLSTICTGENGRLIATGRALVSARDVAGAF